MAMLSPHSGSGEGSAEEERICPGEILTFGPCSDNSVSTCKSKFPTAQLIRNCHRFHDILSNNKRVAFILFKEMQRYLTITNFFKVNTLRKKNGGKSIP